MGVILQEGEYPSQNVVDSTSVQTMGVRTEIISTTMTNPSLPAFVHNISENENIEVLGFEIQSTVNLNYIEFYMGYSSVEMILNRYNTVTRAYSFLFPQPILLGSNQHLEVDFDPDVSPWLTQIRIIIKRYLL